jgi:hypothetical protein
MPFNLPSITDLPMFHYNLTTLWSELHDSGADQHLTIVSGLCPLSLMSDELTIVYKNGISFRPELGFEPIEAVTEKSTKINGSNSSPISELQFPPRPIFNDYLEMLRVFTTATKLAEIYGSGRIRVKLWLPMHEYYLAIINEIFPKSILEGLLDPRTIEPSMRQLMNRYKKLVAAAASEANYRGQLMLSITNPNSYINQLAELEVLLGMDIEKIMDRYVPDVYGMYKGTPQRKKLYALLALKHFQPLLEDINMHVLHIDNSYELWPSILASNWAEQWSARTADSCGEHGQVFAWLCLPSIPSPSLKYMRALNAPYDHKLYLADKVDSQTSILHDNYFKLISVIMPGLETSLPKELLEKEMSSKIHRLQKFVS